MDLNREQIIKALECCEQYGHCQGCPLNGSGINGCMFKVMHDALTFIKELSDANDKLYNDNERLREIISDGVRLAKEELAEEE